MTDTISLGNLSKQCGYPDMEERRDLWVTPLSPLGIDPDKSKNIRVLYFGGEPRAIFGLDIPDDQLLKFVSGSAFSYPPPIVAAINSGINHYFLLDKDSFRSITDLPVWEGLLKLKAGAISVDQADLVVKETADGNQKWYQNDRSRRMVGALPRIFPEGTVILYELLQNAADSGATNAKFEVVQDTLLFSHNGYRFTENDVYAISFVNSSFKSADTIGFMGLGFKAAYEISADPEIHCPPFYFHFDNSVSGGSLFPTSIAPNQRHEPSAGYTTLFRFHLKATAIKQVEQELQRFDGRPLLYIGKKLTKLSTPNGTFEVVPLNNHGDTRLVELRDSRTSIASKVMIFQTEYEPSPEAVEEFSRSRGLEPKQYQRRKQQISIAIQLKEDKPDSSREGELQAYLPTSVKLPTPFDIQGNFLLDATRLRLRNASGPWNLECFEHVVDLVTNMLIWAKGKALSGDNDWLGYYDLVPDWTELCKNLKLDVNEETPDKMKSRFKDFLDGQALIPVSDGDGKLSFVPSAAATGIDADLESVFIPKDLLKLQGAQPVWFEISSQAKEVLLGYLNFFGSEQLLVQLARGDWENNIESLKALPSKESRIQLAKILAYLESVRYSSIMQLQSSRIILNQEGKLRASHQEGLKKIISLPEVEVGFPDEELALVYDSVNITLRRELNRPTEMGLSSEVTQATVRSLEVLAPILGAKAIATDIIFPLFSGDKWKDIPDDRLLSYTRFVMLHFKEIKPYFSDGSLLIKVKSTTKEYFNPKEIYFGKEYSLEGERLERICGVNGAIKFLSEEYLKLGRTYLKDWTEFFSDLGVQKYPRLQTSTTYIHDWYVDELKKATGDPSFRPSDLRASQIADIPYNSYAVDDYSLDPAIETIVRNLYTTKPPGWRTSLADFAKLVDLNWDNYKESVKKNIRYAYVRTSTIHSRKVPALSSFGLLILEEPWVPVYDIDKACKPSDLVIFSQENKEMAGEQTLFSFCEFTSGELISFLKINERPPESTPLRRLRVAVTKQITDVSQFIALYSELESNPGDAIALRQIFADEALIYIPSQEQIYYTSNQVLFSEKTTLGPWFSAISATYPGLQRFFCEMLGVPKEEQIEHYIQFLADYVWSTQPTMNDYLRSSIESCYRKLIHYLNGAEEELEDTKNNLSAKLGVERFVFCGTLGWVKTSEKFVIYPDTRLYEEFVKSIESVAIESHIKRLAYPLSEVEHLLSVFNIHPLSRVLDVTAEINDPQDLDNGTELANRLSMLIHKSVALVEFQQKENETIKKSIAPFFREWENLKDKIDKVKFWHAKSILIKVSLSQEPDKVFQTQLNAYIKTNLDSLDIYLAGDIVEVFDTLTDQLCQIIRIELIPTAIREDVIKLFRNIARLNHQKFEENLNQQLKEKGLDAEENPEANKILDEAAKNLMEQAKQDTGAQEPEDTAGGSKVPTQTAPATGNAKPSAKLVEKPIPTKEEILAKLPAFNDASFGKVNDLTTTTSWENGSQAVKNVHGKGSGGHGGGNMATLRAWQQAYGQRGELWVVELEKRKLSALGRQDLADQVKHKSLEYEGSPWDIESFLKTPPFSPIYVEVKSTPRPEDFTVEMSAEQIRIALSPTTRPYYLYRVTEIDTSNPHLYIYDLRKIAHLLRVSTANVEVSLPKPQRNQ